MRSPTVSVCLPVYNGANYLAQAIESVLAQKFEDLELLIADDCSTDDTKAIVQEYSSKDKRIKSWTNPQNLKLFGNYNACIEKASGRYIKLYAHDDLFEPDLIGDMVAVLDQNPDISLVSSARHWIDAEGKIILPDSDVATRTMMPFNTNKRVSSNKAISSTLAEVVNWLGEPSSQMFRKENADGGYDTSFKQIGDLEYSYRLLKAGDYYFLADRYCYFRRHAESWSTARSTDLPALMDWFLLGSRYRQYLDLIPMNSEEYCLNVIRALTCNFEANLHSSNRFGPEEKHAVLKKLCDKRDPLSFFNSAKNEERDSLTESRAMAAIAFLATALLENELRLVHAELATPYSTFTDVDRLNGDCTTRSAETSELDDFSRDISGTSSMIPKGSTNVPKALYQAGGIRSGIALALAGMKSALRARDREIEQLRGSLDEMGNSVSWKVTEPLRMIKRHFR